MASTYRVTYNDSNNEWRVLKSGKFVSVSSTKRAAKSQAKHAAKRRADYAAEDTKVIVEKKSGTKQNTFNFKGSDQVDPLGGFDI